MPDTGTSFEPSRRLPLKVPLAVLPLLAAAIAVMTAVFVLAPRERGDLSCGRACSMALPRS